MLVFVLKKNKLAKEEEINHLLCPSCQNLVILNENKDKDITIECGNNHKIKYSTMSEFMNSQNIDDSNYKCSFCNNKKNYYSNNNF